MIHFLMCMFRQLQYYSNYWALEDARAAEWALGQPTTYCHITRYANCISDDMARPALEA